MRRADENLRYRATAGSFDHRGRSDSVVLDADFVERYAFVFQQSFGGYAIEAIGRGIDRDSAHDKIPFFDYGLIRFADQSASLTVIGTGLRSELATGE
jgi:hypothetical protein